MPQYKMHKVFLCIPPCYETTVPPLGTPALVGFLKSKGVPAAQLDLNIAYFDYLKEKNLNYVQEDSFFKKKKKDNLYYSHMLAEGKLDGTEPLYSYEKNPGAPYYFTENILSSRLLFRYIRDKKENIFYNFIYEKLVPQIKKNKVGLLGLSLTSPSQVIASLTAGFIVKKEFPAIHVCLGGQWVSLFQEELMKRNDFSLFFDSLIYNEGETPLYQLMLALSQKKDLSLVPNCIYNTGREFTRGSISSEENLNLLPPPDFDGLRLKKYSSFRNYKGPVLTYETSRGCYWNKCIFCMDLPLPKPAYREKDPQLVVSDIKHLIKKYKVKFLVISNAIFSVWQMKDVCRRLIAEKVKVSWWCLTRFDERFDRRIFRLAKKAGCREIGFAMESMNQRVLDVTRKGTKVETIKRLMRQARSVGLKIYLQVIIGLPTETIKEAMNTIGFLIENKNLFERAAFNTYYLTPKNSVFLCPEKYNIICRKDSRVPFRYFHRYRHTDTKFNLKTKKAFMLMFHKLLMLDQTRSKKRR